MRKECYVFVLLVAGLFCLGSDASSGWSSAQRLSWTSGFSGNQAMAIDSGDTVHIVWEDDTPGNSEIYYKRGSL
jgi:hypothetical protein